MDLNGGFVSDNWTLKDGYSLRVMDSDEFRPLFQKYTQEFFDDATQVFRLRDTLSDLERDKLKSLQTYMGEPYLLRLGLFKNNEFVGWHFGRQEDSTTFYMQNSGILPEHRRKGLYTELVKKTLEFTSDMGFQRIYSRHNATNNAVIIPKLKHGFVITAMEVTDLFGTLIHLTYFPKETRRKMTDFRVGQIKPDQEIKDLLGI